MVRVNAQGQGDLQSTAYMAEKLGRHWIVGDINDFLSAKERLLDLANGVHPEWKSATRRRFVAPDVCADISGPLFS